MCIEFGYRGSSIHRYFWKKGWSFSAGDGSLCSSDFEVLLLVLDYLSHLFGPFTTGNAGNITDKINVFEKFIIYILYKFMR